MKRSYIRPRQAPLLLVQNPWIPMRQICCFCEFVCVLDPFCYYKKKNAPENIIEQMSLKYDGVSFRHNTRSGTAGSWGREILHFLGNHHIAKQSDCTSLDSQQQWRSIHLLHIVINISYNFCSMIFAILTCIWWNLKDVLIWIFLMAKDVEYFCNVFFLCFDIFPLTIFCLVLYPFLK